ncbi:MAG: hypothetical protein CMO80_13455 [Verrucomicrobiales bacterium]|nr:hypothetical protein [Verrucomicrobiales bacterium]
MFMFLCLVAAPARIQSRSSSWFSDTTGLDATSFKAEAEADNSDEEGAVNGFLMRKFLVQKCLSKHPSNHLPLSA